ncbi:MAG: PRC-barrel domain-containing protein [Myxococcaceae bacterium]
MRISDDKLRGKTVIEAGGQALGQVEALILETDRWSVEGLEIRPRREVASQLGSARRLGRPNNAEIPIRTVKSVGDAILLSLSLDELGALLTGAAREGAPLY